MKSFLYILLGIFILYFQLIIAPNFTLFAVIPNFFIAYLVYISIHIKEKLLYPLSFFLGLALDIMHPTLLGLNTLLFLIISFLVSKFHMNVNKQRFLIVSLSVLFLNFLYYFVSFIYHALAAQLTEGFFLIFLISLLYNTLISILVIYALVLSEKIKVTLNV